MVAITIAAVVMMQTLREASAADYTATFRLTLTGGHAPDGPFGALLASGSPGAAVLVAGLNTELAARASPLRVLADGTAVVMMRRVEVSALTALACGGNSGNGRYYSRASDGVCAGCTVCAGATPYETRECGGTVDATCGSECRAGEYSPAPRQGEYQWRRRCVECGAGHYAGTFQPAATACTVCAAGMFAAGTGATACDACGDGTTSLPGSGRCFDAVSGGPQIGGPVFITPAHMHAAQRPHQQTHIPHRTNIIASRARI
jgi:hypothetical protein